MNKKPLLSICIPTYNREFYLEQLLASIVSQKEFYDTDDVEIVIDDGPSKDNTTALVKRYQESYPGKIRYFRNDVAIGMCPAFLEAIELSGGEYTWLFGSDDLMTSVALSATLDMIRKEKPGIILSDRHVFFDLDTDGKPPLNTNKDDIILDGPSQFIKHLGDDNKQNGRMNGNFFTFISIFCFKQEMYLKSKKKFLESYGKKYDRLDRNYFNFSMIVFYDLHSEKIVILKSKILVLCKGGNHWWSFKSMEIAKDLYFSLKVFRKNYNLTLKCHLFFNHMILGWTIASIGWIVKNHPILNKIHKPLAALMRRFV